MNVGIDWPSCFTKSWGEGHNFSFAKTKLEIFFSKG